MSLKYGLIFFHIGFQVEVLQVCFEFPGDFEYYRRLTQKHESKNQFLEIFFFLNNYLSVFFSIKFKFLDIFK